MQTQIDLKLQTQTQTLFLWADPGTRTVKSQTSVWISISNSAASNSCAILFQTVASVTTSTAHKMWGHCGWGAILQGSPKRRHCFFGALTAVAGTQEPAGSSTAASWDGPSISATSRQPDIILPFGPETLDRFRRFASTQLPICFVS